MAAGSCYSFLFGSVASLSLCLRLSLSGAIGEGSRSRTEKDGESDVELS